MTSAMLVDLVPLNKPTYRVAGLTHQTALRRVNDNLHRSVSASRFLTTQNVFTQYERVLQSLLTVGENWNSYGAPAPTQTAIDLGKRILSELRSHLVQPEKISPSAEGGVAITFFSQGPNRAIIEALNDGEKYLFLYDIHGNAKTYPWPETSTEAVILIDSLRRYLKNDELTASAR